MDSASEAESRGSPHGSDASSIDGANANSFRNMSRELLLKRLESLMQENKVLKLETDAHRLKVRGLQNENKDLRQASVHIQQMAEQEEEFISNTLMKKIEALKREKETLALNYEQEEECLTNELTRKMVKLKEEKDNLEQTLANEQEQQVTKLVRKIKNLENETHSKQGVLDQLRREKVELENALEQEQEALVNRLWKQMDQLEAEKRMLQGKLTDASSSTSSAQSLPILAASATGVFSGEGPIAMQFPNSVGMAAHAGPGPMPARSHHPRLSALSAAMSQIPASEQVHTLQLHVTRLREEVVRLKDQLLDASKQHAERMREVAQEEQMLRDENLRLQRRLQMEVERREMLCRHLSESESSLEMEDERHFNELSKSGQLFTPTIGGTSNSMIGIVSSSGPFAVTTSSVGPTGDVTSLSSMVSGAKGRAVSSPVPHGNPLHIRTVSPGSAVMAASAGIQAAGPSSMFGPPSPCRSSVGSAASMCPTCGQPVTLTPASSTAALVQSVGLSTSPPHYGGGMFSGFPAPQPPGSGVFRSNSHQRLAMTNSTGNPLVQVYGMPNCPTACCAPPGTALNTSTPQQTVGTLTPHGLASNSTPPAGSSTSQPMNSQ